MLFAFHLRIHQNKTWATHNFFIIYFLISSSQGLRPVYSAGQGILFTTRKMRVTYTHRLISNFVDSISLFASMNINFASLHFQKYINCTGSLSSSQHELTCQSNLQQNNWKIRLFIPLKRLLSDNCPPYGWITSCLYYRRLQNAGNYTAIERKAAQFSSAVKHTIFDPPRGDANSCLFANLNCKTYFLKYNLPAFWWSDGFFCNTNRDVD